MDILRPTFLAFLALAAAYAQNAPAGPAAGKDKVVGGPYTVNVTQNSATVMWVVETGHASLGTTLGKLNRAAPVLHTDRVSYAGLEPGKTYYYDTLSGRPEGKGYFRTAPRGDVPFQFVVYGDTRTRHDVHRKVISTMLAKTAPEFAIQTGDLVENALDSAQWPIYFDIEKEWLRKISFFPVPGNHERNDRTYFDLFEAKPYYSFDWGAVHFIMLDSDITNVSPLPAGQKQFWTDELKWLEEELKASQSANLRFVVAHHGPLSAYSTRLPQPHMADIMPLLEKYKATGLFGHDHNYQHYLRNNIHYLISGGGGAPLYDVNRPPAGITQKVVSIENFLIFNVQGKTAHVQAIDINGQTIEAFDVSY